MAKKEIKKNNISNDNEIAKLVKLVIIVTLVFLAFYVLTIFINKEEEKEVAESTPASIQYEVILAGNILKQNPSSYYVLVYDTEDYNHTVYEAYASLYEDAKSAIPVYKVELNNPFNLKFVAEESKLDVKNIEDLKLKGTTLLKVEKQKITKYYEDEEVLTKLKELAESVKEKEEE